ncbi:MAG: hypothetical protein LBS21_07965 [Clostridiales bacterium]|nr:hypothetical protein [Clostridiales bacterium]
MGNFSDRVMIGLYAGYLRLVCATCKMTQQGWFNFRESGEKVAFSFWHGSSYLMYPQMQHTGTAIITTINRRGDFVKGIGEKFGYVPFRLPDEEKQASGDVRKLIKETANSHIAIAMDGPLGPYHIPKRFLFTIAYLSKKRIVPLTVSAKRVIRLTKRWDKFIIPLPFSEIVVTFHEPLTVQKENFDELKEKIVSINGGNTE